MRKISGRRQRGRTELNPSTRAKRQEEETVPGCFIVDFAHSAKIKKEREKASVMWRGFRCRPGGAAELGCGQRPRIAGGCGQDGGERDELPGKSSPLHFMSGRSRRPGRF